MAEPRARTRPRGSLQFHTHDLQEFLYAFGDAGPTSLTQTISTLDAILTDFITETCHQAALCASYSRRQKIKVDDFEWVLRHDEALLGRTLEQMWKDKKFRDERRIVDMTETAMGVGQLEGIAELGGAGKEMKGKKGRRGKKRGAGDEGGGGGVKKRQKSEE
jgi:transcription initiation factor TFIID subunit 13